MVNKHSKLMGLLLIVLVASALISLRIGRYALSLEQILQILTAKLTALPIDSIHQQVIFQVRLPRILSALCVGAGLALSGAALQGIFRNPLVDPHIIGVTSGSAFGGTLAIFFSLSLYGLLQYVSDTEEKLPSIVFWLMGSFATANTEKWLFFFVPFVCCSIVLLKLSWRLNLLSLEDKEAKALGVKVGRLRWLVIGLSGTLVACQVAISGSIGWVGLIIPHISRMLVGANHQRLLPCTMLVGAIYMLWVDNAARALTDNEIPISILTALIGAPLFGILVYRLKRNGAMRD